MGASFKGRPSVTVGLIYAQMALKEMSVNIF